MDTKPEGVSELIYELQLVDKVSGNIPAPVIGSLKNSGAEAVIEFKRTAENPLLAGFSYRLTVVGATNNTLYEYLDEPRKSDGKSIYHMTSIGKISETNSLKLTSVKRYNLKGKPLFSLTVNIANPDIGVITGSKAQLACTGNDALAADMTQTLGQFVFNFNTTHFPTTDPIACTQLQVTAGDKIFVNKNPLKLSLVKQTASFPIGLTLEEKKIPDGITDGINTELVNHLNGTFADFCGVISAQLPAVETYRVVSFDFKMSAGDNKGKAVRTITIYSDKDCKIATADLPVVTNYDLEILNPALVTLANTLPISFYKVGGADRILETHTIVNVSDNKLKFGAMVQGSDVWSGSKDLAALPTELSLFEYSLRAPQQ
jgi:hypothetical protein